MANQNPTLQTTGALEALLRLDWNCAFLPSGGTLSGMLVAFDSITYGPANAPPPAWVKGTQYQAMGPTQVPGFGAMIPFNGYTMQAGYAGVLYIPDMSGNSVLSGKTYTLTVDVGYYWIQLYFMITGTGAGSTVLPGFGLWNLGTNPHAWTYVTPEQFTGQWEIGLLSPSSDAPVWLSIEYAPPKQYGSGIASKLVFTCRGGTITQYWSTAASVAMPAPSPGAQRPVGTQYLHDRSDSYVLRGKDGKKLGKG